MYPRQPNEEHSFPWVLMSLAVFLLLGVIVLNLIRVAHIPIPYTVFLLFMGIIFGAIFYGVYTTQVRTVQFHAGKYGSSQIYQVYLAFKYRVKIENHLCK